jgi:tetratricopeptide (TPR) repeat protein
MKALLTILLLCVVRCFAMEAPMMKMRQELTRQLEEFSAALARDPGSIRTLSSRGDTHLFLGKFEEAVADYEKMIALDPGLDASHWRLGIAYHFTRQWEKSSAQFAKYHSYDGRDRENGVWKFFADTRRHDFATARREMLKYTRFDREPFPAIYDLLAGRTTPEQFQAHLDEKQLAGNRQVMFFAHYYRGLFQKWSGEHEKALTDLRAAVGLFPPEKAMSGGPGYMWQCARLHLKMLEEEKGGL